MRAPQLAARRTQEFFFAFWGSMRVKVEGPMRGKMVKVSALEALFMMVKVGRRPETLPWDYVTAAGLPSAIIIYILSM